MTASGFRSVDFTCVYTLFIEMLTLFIKTSCRNLHKNLEPKNKLICVRYCFTKKLGRYIDLRLVDVLFKQVDYNLYKIMVIVITALIDTLAVKMY